MKLFAEVGLDVRVLRIPGAKDPDEFLNKAGPNSHEKFKLLLDQSRAQFEYKLENVLARHDIKIPDERIKAADELCRIIAGISSNAERDVCVGDRIRKARDPAGLAEQRYKAHNERARPLGKAR